MDGRFQCRQYAGSLLRALAVTTATPQEVRPGVPTVGGFVPGYEAAGWQGHCAPSKTPPEIIDKLNRQINAALADPASSEPRIEFWF